MSKSFFRSIPGRSAIEVALGILVLATSAQADRLVAGGSTLQGKVTSLTSAGVEFQPDFAKDAMLVPWDNVEDVSTEASFQVLHGDSGETDAPVRGYQDGKLAVGEESIDPKTLVAAVPLDGEGLGFADRTRSKWRHWSGGLDVGFNLQQATTDNMGVMVALRALRAKDPTRLILGMNYRYGTEKGVGTPESRTQDSVSGLLRGEYDFTERVYGYASTDALYDAIQELSLRAVPKAGVGYVVWEREPKEGVRDFLQVEVGGGWVYERYFGPGPLDPIDDDYFTVAFGVLAAYMLPRGASIDWRFDWLPAVDDFTGDYVIRTEAGLNVPLVAPVSARLSIADTYDSTPAAGSDENSLYVASGLSVGW